MEGAGNRGSRRPQLGSEGHWLGRGQWVVSEGHQAGGGGCRCGVRGTLGVAEQVDTVSCVGHDGGDGTAETFDLEPERPEALAVVKQVNHRHVGAWVCL